jgi:hypothetical protein
MCIIRLQVWRMPYAVWVCRMYDARVGGGALISVARVELAAYSAGHWCASSAAPPRVDSLSRAVPHSTTSVSSYYFIRVLILLHLCPHTTLFVSSYYYICVLILLYSCPHTTTSVSSYYFIRVLILLCMCPYYFIRVLILLHMCPHTTLYVSSYYYIYIFFFYVLCEWTLFRARYHTRSKACQQLVKHVSS